MQSAGHTASGVLAAQLAPTLSLSSNSGSCEVRGSLCAVFADSLCSAPSDQALCTFLEWISQGGTCLQIWPCDVRSERVVRQYIETKAKTPRDWSLGQDACVWIPATLFPIQLPADASSGQVLRLLPPTRGTWVSTWLLLLAWPSPTCFRYLGRREPADRRISHLNFQAYENK